MYFYAEIVRFAGSKPIYSQLYLLIKKKKKKKKKKKIKKKKINK